MIMFVGQVAREMREREAFQELDYRAVFGTMAKWATEIDDPARIPELVSRAFYTAMNGRPGPVVVALPEDMLTERVVGRRCARGRAGRDLAGPHRHGAAAEDAVGGGKADHGARRQPLVGAACAAIARFAERFELPVVTTFRRLHLFTQCIPATPAISASGQSEGAARVKAADLVLLVGGRLGEMPSQGYTLLDIPNPKTKFVHVHPCSGRTRPRIPA